MQAAIESSPTSSSFAGVLAALTGARNKSSSNWEDDLERELAPDVATLSYERALSAHARYRPELSSTAAFHPETTPELRSPAPPKQTAGQGSEGFSQRTSTAALEEKRMRASVTLRMSKAEFAQLQQRAAEAGLTVSAYLRSCTFEVESLRAQVKQALAELRTARAASSQPPRTSWLPHFLELLRIRRPAIA